MSVQHSMIYMGFCFQLETLEGTTEDLTKRLAEAPHLESLPQQVTDLKQVCVILLTGTAHQLNDKDSWKNAKPSSIMLEEHSYAQTDQVIKD